MEATELRTEWVEALQQQLLKPRVLEDKDLCDLMYKWQYMPWRKRRKDWRKFVTNQGEYAYDSWREFDDRATYKQCRFIRNLLEAKSPDCADELLTIVASDHPGSNVTSLDEATFGQAAWLIGCLKGVTTPRDS
jgi:hypothetical protein